MIKYKVFMIGVSDITSIRNSDTRTSVCVSSCMAKQKHGNLCVNNATGGCSKPIVEAVQYPLTLEIVGEISTPLKALWRSPCHKLALTALLVHESR